MKGNNQHYLYTGCPKSAERGGKLNLSSFKFRLDFLSKGQKPGSYRVKRYKQSIIHLGLFKGTFTSVTSCSYNVGGSYGQSD